MKIHTDDIFAASKKYSDLSFRKIDSEVFFMLKVLIYDMQQFTAKMWEWPPKGLSKKIEDQLTRYDTILIEAISNNYPLNGHFIMGMAELLEKVIEENSPYIKKQYVENSFYLRDRASAILVMIRLFEDGMDKIEIY